MRILCSRWIIARLALMACALAVIVLVFLTGTFPLRFVVGVVGVGAIVWGIRWASSDVVIVTRTRIFRGFKSLELAKVQDLVLAPTELDLGSGNKIEGLQIVAVTGDGEWPVGLFSEGISPRWGVQPLVQARLIALRELILR
jgi:hypothetical protein